MHGNHVLCSPVTQTDASVQTGSVSLALTDTHWSDAHTASPSEPERTLWGGFHGGGVWWKTRFSCRWWTGWEGNRRLHMGHCPTWQKTQCLRSDPPQKLRRWRQQNIIGLKVQQQMEWKRFSLGHRKFTMPLNTRNTTNGFTMQSMHIICGWSYKFGKMRSTRDTATYNASISLELELELQVFFWACIKTAKRTPLFPRNRESVFIFGLNHPGQSFKSILQINPFDCTQFTHQKTIDSEQLLSIHTFSMTLTNQGKGSLSGSLLGSTGGPIKHYHGSIICWLLW